ncbi:hypothetical protein AGMMS50256_30380 [Betaproteobacteria bacterium]|nr:hypothetical protein AGMMS50256_30290 [Betaproteobacteria bacterium]GHU35342.1 hypothetical protein AGMMS50256_30380 [Betaproteobacteria bacterium]
MRDQLRIIEPVIHAQLAGYQVEVEANDPRQGFQTLTDQAFLGGAIHLVDAVAHLAGVFRWWSLCRVSKFTAGVCVNAVGVQMGWAASIRRRLMLMAGTRTRISFL